MPRPRRLVPLVLTAISFALAYPSFAAWSPSGDPVCSATGAQVSIVSTAIPGCIVDPCPAPSLVVWRDYRDAAGSGADLYYSTVDAGGVYGSPPGGTALCAAPGDQSAVVLARSGVFGGPLGGSGCVIAAWSDLRSGAYDVYSQRIGGGTAPAWPENGLAVCTAAGAQTDVAVAGDPDGGAIVAWIDARAGGWAVYAQRLDAQGGALWTMDGIPVCVSSGTRFGLLAAEDGAGGAYLAWTDWRSGHREVYATHLTSSGTAATGWTLDGVRIGSAGYEQAATHLLPDGSGGALFVWFDPGSDPFRDFYVLRVRTDATLSPGWPAAGRALTGPAGSWRTISDALEYDGGLIVAWQEDSYWTDIWPPPPIDTDLHLQRVLAGGAIAWADSGMVFCTGTGHRGSARLARSDDGVMAVWEDDRSGQTDLYGIRVQDDGVVDPRWPANGAPISDAPGTQAGAAPQSVGIGGAVLVTWVDRRSGQDDIYARLVAEDGTVGVEGTPRPAVAFTLSAPRPNPSRGAVRFALELPRAGRLEADVIDPSGRRIARLASGTYGPGRQEVTWGGVAEGGTSARAGLYFLRVTFEGERLSRALVRLR